MAAKLLYRYSAVSEKEDPDHTSEWALCIRVRSVSKWFAGLNSTDEQDASLLSINGQKLIGYGDNR